MSELSSKKQGFKKCRSATFSIDGFSFTIGKTSWPVAILPFQMHYPALVEILDFVWNRGGFWFDLFKTVANEAGESSTRPLARFARSKSQNALWNAITAGIGIKDKDKRGILIDPRSPEEILADDLPSIETPDAMEKTAI
ncbi:hypothetical protein DNTS_004570, partial [Danionella cerebrum]